jgi:hypothetical protein
MTDDAVARSNDPTPLLSDEDLTRLPALLAERDARLAADATVRSESDLFNTLRQLMQERRRVPRRVGTSLLTSE